MSDIQDNDPGTFGKALKVLAYPLSATIGAAYAHIHARNKLYDLLKFTPEIDKARHEHWDRLNSIVASTTDIKETLSAEHSRYSGKVTQFFRERGFHNTFDYIKGLQHNQKIETALAFFTAAGISLGVMLTIADHKSLLDRFRPEHKPDDQTVAK